MLWQIVNANNPNESQQVDGLFTDAVSVAQRYVSTDSSCWRIFNGEKRLGEVTLRGARHVDALANHVAWDTPHGIMAGTAESKPFDQVYVRRVDGTVCTVPYASLRQATADDVLAAVNQFTRAQP
jgi:hypothetical protein